MSWKSMPFSHVPLTKAGRPSVFRYNGGAVHFHKIGSADAVVAGATMSPILFVQQDTIVEVWEGASEPELRSKLKEVALGDLDAGSEFFWDAKGESPPC